jgi:hypothetical protein
MSTATPDTLKYPSVQGDLGSPSQSINTALLQTNVSQDTGHISGFDTVNTATYVGPGEVEQENEAMDVTTNIIPTVVPMGTTEDGSTVQDINQPTLTNAMDVDTSVQQIVADDETVGRAEVDDNSQDKTTEMEGPLEHDTKQDDVNTTDSTIILNEDTGIYDEGEATSDKPVVVQELVNRVLEEEDPSARATLEEDEEEDDESADIEDQGVEDQDILTHVNDDNVSDIDEDEIPVIDLEEHRCQYYSAMKTNVESFPEWQQSLEKAKLAIEQDYKEGQKLYKKADKLMETERKEKGYLDPRWNPVMKDKAEHRRYLGTAEKREDAAALLKFDNLVAMRRLTEDEIDAIPGLFTYPVPPKYQVIFKRGVDGQERGCTYVTESWARLNVCPIFLNDLLDASHGVMQSPYLDVPVTKPNNYEYSKMLITAIRLTATRLPATAEHEFVMGKQIWEYGVRPYEKE